MAKPTLKPERAPALALHDVIKKQQGKLEHIHEVPESDLGSGATVIREYLLPNGERLLVVDRPRNAEVYVRTGITGETEFENAVTAIRYLAKMGMS